MLVPDRIVVVGGGSAGWMTASTLKRAFPQRDIVVIESPDVPIVGVGESTLGGIRDWTRYMGLDEDSFFPATDASYKMSIKFTDFRKKGAGGFHYPFGTPQSDPERHPYLDWHMKKFLHPETPITDFVDCLFPAQALFETNKFSTNEDGVFDTYNPQTDVAYHFDATKFGIWLRDTYCIPNGVTHIKATVETINTGDEGITSLILDTGEEVKGDLYVDCTGWRSILLGGALNEPFESWEDILPNNSAVATHLPYKDKELELEPFTNSTAIGHGWVWNIPLWSRIGTGYVYSDKYLSFDEAVEEFKQHLMSDNMVIPRTREEVDALTFKPIKMRVGIHERTFVKNVLAIGLSAGFIEPLESNGLFSVHEFLTKAVDVLTNFEITQTYRDMYNISAKNLFTSFAKFVAIHYSLSRRDDTQYWKDISNRTFQGHDGDPYSSQTTYNNGFQTLGFAYMDEWGWPFNHSGVPFIATGLGMEMITEQRFLNMCFRNKRDYKAEVDAQTIVWESRKKRWVRNAKKAPTLMQYLHEKFYKKLEDN
jgi:tryptophan halogenase